MNPPYFYNLYTTTIKDYYGKQYPDTNDCYLLDVQMKKIQQDLSDIYNRIIAGYKEFPDKHFNSQKNTIASHYRADSKTYLQDILLHRQNKFNSLECRNKIELDRQKESLGVFNTQASKSDKVVLTQTNNKQIIYAVVGSILVITTLYIVTKK